jgi:hypothetical protein
MLKVHFQPQTVEEQKVEPTTGKDGLEQWKGGDHPGAATSDSGTSTKSTTSEYSSIEVSEATRS